MNQLDAYLYLIPRRGAFWRWSKGAQGIEWQDGRTLAFRGEIIEVLAHLAPLGLPPFGSVLLVFAATRDNWQAADNRARIISSYDIAKPNHPVVSSLVASKLQAEQNIIMDGLDRIAQLPSELRQSIAAKRVIAETIFECAHRPTPAKTAAQIVRSLSEGFDPEPLFDSAKTGDVLQALAAEMQILREGLRVIDPQQLAMRLRTGLDESIEPAPVEIPDPLKVRTLLAQLRDDEELAGVAQIARNLLAAIHIPRALAAPLELPVGGVSDLSNRGDLDRLLISELAHDDLTLATRIALNEALYLRREAPVSTPPRGRIVMIDTGIRMWGIARVFATSVGLALAASSESDKVHCFRPRGQGVEPADLASREGLIAQLEALDPAPHPAHAIREMIDSLHEETRDADVMLVTHEDVCDDPDFIRALREIDPHREWYIAAINHIGGFRLLLMTSTGRRALCSAELSLKDLLHPPTHKRPATSLRDHSIDKDLPVILSTHPFPLLLPAQADPRRAVISTKHVLLSVTREGGFMQWRSGVRGAIQLCAEVPKGRAMGMFVDEPGSAAFYVSSETPAGKPPKTNVLIVDLHGNMWRQPRVDVAEILRAAAYHAGVLLLLYDKQVIAISAQGQLLAQREVPIGYRWHSGRFYSDKSAQWDAAYFTGQNITFADVSKRDSQTLFDREGHGPWQLLRGGFVAPAIGEPITVAKKPPNLGRIESVRVSPDGNRIIARMFHGVLRPVREWFFLDLNHQPLAWRKLTQDGNENCLLHGDALKWGSGLNVYNKFDAIYANETGELVLMRGQRELAIRLNKSAGLNFENIATFGSPYYTRSAVASFGPRRCAPNARYRLRIAKWNDGSRAFLDSRGMLHLKSSDADLPEITLVLGVTGIAGRTSEGHTFGWAFFHRDKPTVEPAYIHDLLRQFAVRLR